ncbi:hypothetical protein SAMN05421505_1204 [Sinosporangium album]|uniref:Uncharacterized protein n=1 Tax=Sinosporangium album TaxID=504805 RepID=A0A1G8EA18_9ACTN|nr:hypothetical protein [Sinosporangium album]SDH66687.1 hypothetical protein SAMN05421505_1204 [Sinosporangium album]
MGRTVHEDAAATLLDDILTTPEAAATFAEIRSRLRTQSNHWFNDGYIDAIGQLHAKDPADWPAEQAAAFTLIHSRLMAGTYMHLRAKLGQPPGPDADRTGNAEALTRLPWPLTARLDLAQQGADQDGTLAWRCSVTADGCSTGTALLPDCANEAPSPLTTVRSIPPRTVPLEVGYTMPSRTLLHLHRDGGVARWPHRSTDIHILVNLASGSIDD